jgi:hypothetical protein
MKYLIKGITTSGAVFRPSDWTDRLCSVFAQFRPTTHLRSINEAHNHKMQGYSTYVMPAFVDGVRSVILDSRLGNIEILALEFVLNFARDNDLTVIENYEEVLQVEETQAA